MSNKNQLFDTVEEYQAEDDPSSVIRTVRLWKKTLSEHAKILASDKGVLFGAMNLIFFVLIAVFAPLIAPHGPKERLYQGDTQQMAKWMDPSFMGGKGLLGTTAQGYDIFSQLIYGARPALIVGFLAAVLTVGVGTVIGLVAGYYGGYTDDLLMRLVDFAYGIPLLPTVIVLVSLLGASKWNVILAILVIQWRTSARVIRSQVLSLRERPYVKFARIAGASDWRIISRHIAPNIIPLSFLYAAFAVSWAIITEAGVSFLGLGNPNEVSWGTMLMSSRTYSAMSFGAWWWIVPPGLCISLIVISCYLIGQGYEEIVNPELQGR